MRLLLKYDNTFFERKGFLMQITILLPKFIAGVIAGGVLSTALAMVTQRSLNQYGVLAGLLVAVLCLMFAYWAETAGQVWCILLSGIGCWWNWGK